MSPIRAAGSRRARRLVLVLLLLAGSWIATVHPFEHGPGVPQGDCPLCAWCRLPSDGMAAETVTVPPPAAPAFRRLAPAAPAPRLQRRRVHLARAPPLPTA